MAAGQAGRVFAGLALGLALAACDMPVPDASAPAPPRGATAADDVPSARSKALAARYARTERDLKAEACCAPMAAGPIRPSPTPI